MDFRNIKSPLIFFLASLLLVGLFDLVAYTGVHDFAHYKDYAHLDEHTEQLIRTLDLERSLPEQVATLNAQIPNDNHYIALLNEHAAIEQDPLSPGLEGLTAEMVFTALGQQAAIQRESYIQEKEYLWAARRIPNTPYALLTVLENPHDEGAANAYYEFIGVPLTITAFFGIWISLWAGVALVKQVQKHKQIARHKATFDQVTKLPNSTSLLYTIGQTLQTHPGEHALCIISLDRFREINDSLGHDNGDEVLRQVGTRLKAASRATDMVARFGGKKFAIFLANSNTNAIDIVSQKLLSALDPAFEIGGHRLYIRGTMGMALTPEHASDAKTLIHKADIAIKQAQAQSRDVAIYDPENDNNNAERLDLANDLRNAINDSTLELYYQPQLNLETQRIDGAEALCRWIRPKKGFIPPDVFIEIAERTGLIKPLTEWVMETAIKQCAQWHKAGMPLHISINLSARSLHDEGLMDNIQALVNNHELAPQHIILEITETAMMLNPEHAKTLLTRLHDFGLRVSIDDFGTGYSSLGYLKQLPIEEIKIDRSFVMNMAKDENDASIVKATVGLAHDLGLKVVAEGIEDIQTLERLRALRCDLAQGYHISKPMPAREFFEILKHWNAPAATPSSADTSDQHQAKDSSRGDTLSPTFKHA